MTQLQLTILSPASLLDHPPLDSADDDAVGRGGQRVTGVVDRLQQNRDGLGGQTQRVALGQRHPPELVVQGGDDSLAGGE